MFWRHGIKQVCMCVFQNEKGVSANMLHQNSLIDYSKTSKHTRGYFHKKTMTIDNGWECFRRIKSMPLYYFIVQRLYLSKWNCCRRLLNKEKLFFVFLCSFYAKCVEVGYPFIHSQHSIHYSKIWIWIIIEIHSDGFTVFSPRQYLFVLICVKKKKTE